jgi:HEPN domain-containing protein
MSDLDHVEVWKAVEQWLSHADSDRRTAAVCLTANPPLLDSASFHCQQAAEKLIKKGFGGAAVPFRKIHDLSDLGEKLGKIYPEFVELITEVELWTAWNIAYRYPMDEEPKPPPSPETLSAALQTIDRLGEKVSGLRHEAPIGKLG